MRVTTEKVRKLCRKEYAGTNASTLSRATIQRLGPKFLLLFFPCLLATAFACQRFLYPPSLAGLEIKGVTLYFFYDVLLLHFPLKATQGIFQRLAFL
jgi:hypothetical protein